MKVGDLVRVRDNVTDSELRSYGINSGIQGLRSGGAITSGHANGQDFRVEDWWVKSEWLEEISLSSTTTERSKTSMVFNVTVTSVPTLRAQENGDEETIIVPSEQLVAKEQNAALLLAGANNAEAINKVKGSTLRAIVQQVG